MNATTETPIIIESDVANAPTTTAVTLEYQQPVEQDLQNTQNYYTRMVDVFVVDSAQMYEIGVNELKKIKAKAKELEEQRKSITAPMDLAKKTVMDMYRPATDSLTYAEKTLKGKLMAYDEEQQAIQRQRQAEAEAEAERQRLLLAEQAQQAEQSGNQAMADALLETACIVVAPVVIKDVPKVSGVSTRITWKAEVTDKLALVKYIAEHPEYIDMMDANASVLNKFAGAMKQNAKIGGVRFFEDKTMAASRR